MPYNCISQSYISAYYTKGEAVPLLSQQVDLQNPGGRVDEAARVLCVDCDFRNEIGEQEDMMRENISRYGKRVSWHRWAVELRKSKK